jgi:hypothetical protein
LIDVHEIARVHHDWLVLELVFFGEEVNLWNRRILYLDLGRINGMDVEV